MKIGREAVRQKETTEKVLFQMVGDRRGKIRHREMTNVI